MKIAYINNYNAGTGFSVAAIDTILALDSVGIDIVPRNFRLATQYVEPPARIKELEKKSLEDVDVVIQHTIPNYIRYQGGMKNIGYFHCETTHFKSSLWQYNLNLMDEVWVCSQQNKEAAIKSGVTKPIKVVPIPLNVDKFHRNYPSFLEKYKYQYKFYHIGDYSTRKNTLNLIKCYLEEFSKHDNVVLILKSYVEAKSPQDSLQLIQQDVAALKRALRKSPNDIYPPIVIIPDYLSYDQMMSLHAHSNCFITLERAAGWCLPASDAVAMGNWVICNGWGGQNEFMIHSENGFLTDYYMDSVHSMTQCPYQNIYTCHEDWAEPNYKQFKNYMRYAYNSKLSNSIDQQNTLFEKLNYMNAGNKIKEILNATTN